ncbi:MAG TPA: hypothetical protein VNH53_02815 [Sphingomicrobium sp.]|jgi:hypothetical protein|nr:hypothetical protein [Sphingomicrobium sp.]
MPATLTFDESGECCQSPATLIAEFEHAYEELSQYVTELNNVLEQAKLDRAKLTTIRLKIAQLRLIRGPLIGKIAACLKNKISASEAQLLQELRRAHDELLRAASAHTGKWTMDAIEADWEGYRFKARQLARCWMEKVRWEQEILLPLLSRRR